MKYRSFVEYYISNDIISLVISLHYRYYTYETSKINNSFCSIQLPSIYLPGADERSLFVRNLIG